MKIIKKFLHHIKFESFSKFFKFEEFEVFLWKKRRFWLRRDSSPGLSIAGRHFELNHLLFKFELVKIYWLSVKFDWFK